MAWAPFEGGTSIESSGPAKGVIVRDERNDSGTRITLERTALVRQEPTPFAITCDVSGWLWLQVAVCQRDEAEAVLDDMRAAVDKLTGDIAQILLREKPKNITKSRAAQEAVLRLEDRFLSHAAARGGEVIRPFPRGERGP